MTLLSVKNLAIDLARGTDKHRLISDASWQLDSGETLAIVGESGSENHRSRAVCERQVPFDTDNAPPASLGVASVEKSEIDEHERQLSPLICDSKHPLFSRLFDVSSNAAAATVSLLPVMSTAESQALNL